MRKTTCSQSKTVTSRQKKTRMGLGPATIWPHIPGMYRPISAARACTSIGAAIPLAGEANSLIMAEIHAYKDFSFDVLNAYDIRTTRYERWEVS
jgi:hypothetical protein